jgi:xanthine dehydrogenase YagS FAD-binding subunit
MKDTSRSHRLVNVARPAIAARRRRLRIGAAATLIDLSSTPGAEAYPALVEAAQEVGTPQIRHVGTVGGNLAQRPRCWYFRNEDFPCLKKGGSRCFAVDGENQFHAILGGGPCHIVHPSSSVPIVATVGRFAAGASGAREVARATSSSSPTRT